MDNIIEYFNSILYPVDEVAFSPWLTSIIFVSFLTTAFIMIITRLLNAKAKVRDIIGAVVLSGINSLLVFYIVDDYMFFIFMFTSVLWLIYLSIVSRNHLMENIISATMNFALFVNYIIFLRTLNLLKTLDILESEQYVFYYMIAYYILLLIIYFILYIKKISLFQENWVKDFFQIDDAKVRKNRHMLVFSILILILVSMSATYTGVEVGNVNLNYVLSVFSLLLPILFFVLLKFVVEYCILQDKNVRNIRYQHNLEQFMKVIRAQRHDFNVHLHAIKGLIDGDNFAECREYINTIVNDSNSINEVLPVKNPIISAMIHGFREKAESSGIHMHFDISYDMAGLAVTAYDLNRILGNLIQNAIDEITRNKDNKYGIHICISKENDMTVLDVSNRFSGDGNINKIFNAQYTTKRRHEGIGLSTVLRIAQSYEGIVYPEIDDDIIHFIVRLPNETKN